MVSHKRCFLRFEVGDERLGPLAVHMNYHTQCNCLPSSQRLKRWHPGITRVYYDPCHKVHIIYPGQHATVIVAFKL